MLLIDLLPGSRRLTERFAVSLHATAAKGRGERTTRHAVERHGRMTHGTPIRVDHVGIAVESIADAEPFLFLLGCEKLVDEIGESGTFRWAYYRLGNASRIELLEPVGNEESFLTDFLVRHGPGFHHVTLEVADIDAVIESLEAEDVRVIDRTEFDGWIEAFVSPANPTGALFQLMEFKPDYAETTDAGRELYVHGERLEARDN